MDDLPTTAVPPDAPQPEDAAGLSRREFLLLAAFLGGGAVLMLTRCRPPSPEDEEPLEIPAEFRRFMLVIPSSVVPGEKKIVALGGQCPDLACSLWWVDTQEFEFFDSVEQIMARYAQQGERELLWLD